MSVKLIALTEPRIPECRTAEELIAYCARVSSPQNQDKHETAARLLAYCIKHGHWSVFEQVVMTVEIRTSRAIAQQILRHRSFSFQEFSQRYAQTTIVEFPEMREQGGNRQGGEKVIEDEGMKARIAAHLSAGQALYNDLCDEGVAKECARFVLPLCTSTVLYMTGNVRSWIHYFKQRLDSHAQKEHRMVAREISKIFSDNFPAIAQALRETVE